MKRQIELTQTIKPTIDNKNEQSQLSETNSQPKSKRKTQPMILYILVVISELLSVILSIILIFYPALQYQVMFIIYAAISVARCLVFFVNSIVMIGCGKKLIMLYLLLDNTLLMELASIVTHFYLSYNFAKALPISISSMVTYPLVAFFLVGNFRVMLIYCKWNKIQVIVYKLVKLIGSTYFLIYGCSLVIKAENSTSAELLTLWVFTTCGFWGQMYFCVNSFDQSDGLSTKYQLHED